MPTTRRWAPLAVNTYPNQWVETSVAASYGGKRGAVSGSQAPGNYGIVGFVGSHLSRRLQRSRINLGTYGAQRGEFFNFGFGVELANSYADSTLKYFGVRPLINYPIPGPLYDRTSRKYATYNMGIPDQFRVDTFIEEFNERWGEGKDPLPQVLTIILPNDHGASDRPEAGYPFRESYMATTTWRWGAWSSSCRTLRIGKRWPLWSPKTIRRTGSTTSTRTEAC